MTSLLDTLRSIVGDAHVLTEGDLTAWEQDWRRRVRGKALAVVRPASTPEVARWSRPALRQAPPSCRRGNTGLAGRGLHARCIGHADRAQPHAHERRAQRGHRQPHHDRGGGCILQNLQEVARNAGALFPCRWRPRAVAPLAATWAPTRAARRWCATAIRATCAWGWKSSPRRARCGAA